MFTGIIEDVGTVREVLSIKSGVKLNISSKLSKELKNGDSVAVNGACLTVVEEKEDSFSVDVSFETLNRTNLGKLRSGKRVNLERALKLSDRLDGHIVMGHVDTIATIKTIQSVGEFHLLTLEIDSYTFEHSVEKGSIAIDGISLTIARLTKGSLDVAVIPFTYENTNLKYLKPKDSVNIEVDIIGKYIEKFTKKPQTLTEDFLKMHGFA